MLEPYSSQENISNGRVSESYCIKVNNIVLFRFTKRDRNNGGFQRLTVVIVEIFSQVPPLELIRCRRR